MTRSTRACSAAAGEADQVAASNASRAGQRRSTVSMTQPTLQAMTPSLYAALARFEQWNADRWYRYCLRTNHLDARHIGEPLLVTARRGYLLGVGAAALETCWLAVIGVSLVSTASAYAYAYSPKLLIPGVVLLVLELALLTRFALTASKIGDFFREPR